MLSLILEKLRTSSIIRSTSPPHANFGGCLMSAGSPLRRSRPSHANMPHVSIPPPLRTLTGGHKQLDSSGRTVREVIEQIDSDYPGFRDRVISDDRLKPGIAVAVGSRISDLGLLEVLQPDDELHFVLSVSGG